MNDLMTLGRKIEEEYQLYLGEPERSTDELFQMIGEYIKPTIRAIIKKGNYLDEDSLEEIVQEVLLNLYEKGIHEFNSQSAQFATYCTAIAKNKAIDWGRKWIRRRETFYEGDEQQENLMELQASKNQFHLSPEQQYLLYEQMQEQFQMMKKYLNILVNQTDKPYRTLGCCYTLILYNLMNLSTKELSSPGWAYYQMKEQDMDMNAWRFMNQFHKLIPKVELQWGKAFLDGMNEMEDGVFISEMIFGEHFKVKDLENWSLRFRKKVRQQLIEDVFE